MNRFSALGVALLAVAALPLAAQAPRITPAGDPSVQSDTIYHLAVDSAKYPEEDYLLLLDDGVIRLESDGRAVRTYRQVVQILTADGAERWAEQSFGWGPETEKFRLNWIRVLRPDGTVISEGPAQSQESDVPVAMGNPVYSQRKRLRLSLANVAPGTLVDYSTTTEDTKAWIPGDFGTSWSIHTNVPVRRSRLIVDAPAAMHLHIEERNLPRPALRERRGGRQVFTWAASDIPHIKPESFATDTGPKYAHVALSGPLTWNDIGRWYGGLAHDRYGLDSAALAEVQRKVSGAHTALDTVRALHKWVAQDIRYVSVSLGLGGYQPRLPSEVVRTGFGDCKDKATLFVAAMRAVGRRASPVLLSSFAGADDSLPSLGAFDHVIARVEDAPGPMFVDLTAEYTPFGELPRSEEGGIGVVVAPDGPVQVIHFPRTDAAAHAEETILHGTIDTTGRIQGEFLVTAIGGKAVGLRGSYSSTFDSTERAQLGRNILQSLYQGGTADTLEIFSGKDLEAPVRVRMGFSGARVLRRSGRGWILPNPIGTMEGLEETIATVEREDTRDGGRWQPIDLEKVNGPETQEISVEYRLPAGWKPQLPPDVKVAGEFGTYEATYAFVDGVVRIHRVMKGVRGAIAPARIDDVIAFFRAVSADNTPLITLELPQH